MEEEVEGEEGEVETAEEGEEAQAWRGREEAGPGASEHQKIYQHFLKLSLDNCCNITAPTMCAHSHSLVSTGKTSRE